MIDRINPDAGFVCHGRGSAHDRQRHCRHRLICTVGLAVGDYEMVLFGSCSECTEKGK